MNTDRSPPKLTAPPSFKAAEQPRKMAPRTMPSLTRSVNPKKPPPPPLLRATFPKVVPKGDFKSRARIALPKMPTLSGFSANRIRPNSVPSRPPPVSQFQFFGCDDMTISPIDIRKGGGRSPVKPKGVPQLSTNRNLTITPINMKRKSAPPLPQLRPMGPMGMNSAGFPKLPTLSRGYKGPQSNAAAPALPKGGKAKPKMGTLQPKPSLVKNNVNNTSKAGTSQGQTQKRLLTKLQLEGTGLDSDSITIEPAGKAQPDGTGPKVRRNLQTVATIGKQKYVVVPKTKKYLRNMSDNECSAPEEDLVNDEELDGFGKGDGLNDTIDLDTSADSSVVFIEEKIVKPWFDNKKFTLDQLELVMSQVFKFLSPKDLLSVLQVDRTWHKMASEASLVSLKIINLWFLLVSQFVC